MLSDATDALPVFMLGVWQKAHPTELKTFDPFAIDVAPPGVVVDGTGAPSRRMKIANFSTSLKPSNAVAAVMLVVSLGTFAN